MTRALTCSLLFLGLAWLCGPARAAEPGDDLLGGWTAVTQPDGFVEHWTFKKDNKGEWSVRCVYEKGGREVGSFHGENVKFADGALTFKQKFDTKPNPIWSDGAVLSVRAQGEKAPYTWDVGTSKGTGVLTREKK